MPVDVVMCPSRVEGEAMLLTRASVRLVGCIHRLGRSLTSHSWHHAGRRQAGAGLDEAEAARMRRQGEEPPANPYAGFGPDDVGVEGAGWEAWGEGVDQAGADDLVVEGGGDLDAAALDGRADAGRGRMSDAEFHRNREPLSPEQRVVFDKPLQHERRLQRGAQQEQQQAREAERAGTARATGWRETRQRRQQQALQEQQRAEEAERRHMMQEQLEEVRLQQHDRAFTQEELAVEAAAGEAELDAAADDPYVAGPAAGLGEAGAAGAAAAAAAEPMDVDTAGGRAT